MSCGSSLPIAPSLTEADTCPLWPSVTGHRSLSADRWCDSHGALTYRSDRMRPQVSRGPILVPMSDLVAIYEAGDEDVRMVTASNRVEWERTLELLERWLPPAPARVLDIGGGPGRYAAWLAERGYTVQLLDPSAGARREWLACAAPGIAEGSAHRVQR